MKWSKRPRWVLRLATVMLVVSACGGASTAVEVRTARVSAVATSLPTAAPTAGHDSAIASTTSTSQVTGVATPVAPVRDIDAEHDSASLVDASRVRAGLAALRRSEVLDRLAVEWAHAMAASGRLEHGPNPTRAIDLGYGLAGENVGYSGSVERVHEAFVDSETHRSTLLHPEVRELGVGVVVDAIGRVWVAHLFGG